MRTPSTADASLPDDDAQKTEPDKAPRGGRSRTVWNVKGRPAPRQPNERDESSDSGTGAPSEVIRRAHDDVVTGKSGTDRGEATDAVYERNLRGKTPGRERD